MVKIKVNLRTMTPLALLKRLKVHSESITLSPAFSADVEMKTEIETAVAELDDSLVQQDIITQKVQEAAIRVQQAREKGIIAITKLANKVNILSNNNPNLVYELGFETTDSNPTYQTQIDPPIHLTLTESNSTGKLNASVRRMKNAKTYLIQINYDINDDSGWEQILITTRSKNTLSGLESGKRVWVRVAAVGTAGQSDWSDVASRIIP